MCKMHYCPSGSEFPAKFSGTVPGIVYRLQYYFYFTYFSPSDFSSWMFFGFGFIYKTERRNCDVVVKLVFSKLVLGCF